MARGLSIEYSKKVLIAIIILFALIVLSVLIIRNYNKQAGTEVNECQNDADCVKQQLTCCSCNMGGQEACVTKQNATLIEQKLTSSCDEGILCTALYNCKITACKCEKGKCVEG